MTIGVTHHHPTCLEVPNIRLKRGLKHMSFPITDIGFKKTERMIGSHVISKGVTATVFSYSHPHFFESSADSHVTQSSDWV